jgi:hypothetical protein
MSNSSVIAPSLAASNSVTAEKVQILNALMAFKKGDFSVRLPVEWEGLDGKIAEVFNAVMDQSERMADDLNRVSRVVG